MTRPFIPQLKQGVFWRGRIKRLKKFYPEPIFEKDQVELNNKKLPIKFESALIPMVLFKKIQEVEKLQNIEIKEILINEDNECFYIA